MRKSPKPRRPKTLQKNTSTPCRVEAYARNVVAGTVIAGPHVRNECTRFLRDLETGSERGLSFDRAKAEHAMGFFPDCLVLSDGQFDGKPFVLDDSQAFIVGNLFGWLRHDGLRRFRRAYIEIGKGNGKSPLVGGLGLYGMMVDNEPGAEIYAAGATKDQAGILFRDAVRMAKQSPELDQRITYAGKRSPWNMAAPGPPMNGSFFRPISRESGKTGSGPRPHFALCDEVHEHKDRSVMEMLERGFKSRRQPLLIMITNSGTSRTSVCWEEHEHAVAVARGEKDDDTTFTYVCALDDGDNPLEDPGCWIKANPLLGTILTREYLQGVVNQARAMPGKLNAILRLHFCEWTDAETAWMKRSTWDACIDPTLELEQFAGEQCWAGLDLSSTKDLTAKALVFEDGHTEDHKPKYVAFVTGFTPEATVAERELADRVPYTKWINEGHIIATGGPVVRFDDVISSLLDDQQRHILESVAYDKYIISRFEQTAQDLGADLPLIEHPQGWNKRKDTPMSMPDSINMLEALILEGRLRVHDNGALSNAVASARFLTSLAGLRRFEKQRAGGRIDMVIALTMAIGAATTTDDSSLGYITGGVVVR